MDAIFKGEEGSACYIDDMLIHGEETEPEHQAYLQKILQQRINYGLAVNSTKSEFQVHETIVLGHIINGSQVQIDTGKLESMSTWPVPTKMTEVQAFLDFADYYRRSIVDDSAKARPLIDLTKHLPFSWGDHH